MPFPYEPFDLSGVRTYPLGGRASKAHVADFARPVRAGATVRTFIESLPGILAAADFKAIVGAIVDAKAAGGVVWGIGAHVIKTGLGPVLIDLMERGYVSAIATNGAAIIHDFEIALAGGTSEDVDESLGEGRFGMAEETGTGLNAAITAGVARGLGIGQSVGEMLLDIKRPVREQQRGGGRRPTARAGHRSRRHRHRHHPHAPGRVRERDRRRKPPRLQVLRVECRSPRKRRVPQLRLGGHSSRSISQGRGAREESRHLAERPHHRQSRFHPLVSAADQCRHETDGGKRKGYSIVGHHELMIPLLAAAIVDRGDAL